MPTMRSLSEGIYREHELVNFFRQFELSDTVDQSRITADLSVACFHLAVTQG